ncbi:cytochrome C [Paraburkholderia sp. J8-2]|uniref:c-type cytochrome n=1 Tax=Paraburkholderia sp. J8-2 TaxID=2805440 RepID=UPI002AB6234C|nr:cytochrome C [Paraburkholderia sp. J8-2]
MPRKRLPPAFTASRSPGRPRAGAFRLRFIAVSAVSTHAAIALAALPEPTELIEQQHCMFCHTADAPAPFLAPSFHQIAERYRDKPNAHTQLEEKLRRGGKAHWGDLPMPLPVERGAPLSAEDARTLVKWVLSQ